MNTTSRKWVHSEKSTHEYRLRDPYWTLQDVILSESTWQEIRRTLTTISHRPLIYERWNLKSVDPFPRIALNFYGLPGTGKTMAAHGIADYLGKKILALNYAEIESKYVGEAPKNLGKAFGMAEENDAVLFFDEADSILGKRITNVTEGAEQGINSLRSQMLLELDQFSGVVIFATNLVSNFDFAFDSRIIHIHFRLPDEKARLAIWRRHIPEELPLDRDVDLVALARMYEGISGRDIREAVLYAVSKAALLERTCISQIDFVEATKSIIESQRELDEIRKAT